MEIDVNSFVDDAVRFAQQAMLKEVELTPKPGLVDKNNSGSHTDMNIDTFYVSIDAITPYLSRFIHVGLENDTHLFDHLRSIGKECEASMFEATSGVNTHKGMIFSLAVIMGSYGSVFKNNHPPSALDLSKQIKLTCKGLVDADLKNSSCESAGSSFFLTTGDGGIRQEAQNGYPSIFELALPKYIQLKSNHDEEYAMKKTLLILMAHLNDTTLWSRGGFEGMEYVKEQSRRYLEIQDMNFNMLLEKFDTDLIAKNLSPGGSADMLALTWLVYKLLD